MKRGKYDLYVIKFTNDLFKLITFLKKWYFLLKTILSEMFGN